MTSDREFADWLASLPREVPAEEVERRERQHDLERGLYVPAGQIIHHEFEESRH